MVGTPWSLARWLAVAFSLALALPAMGDGQTGAEASELPLTLDETVRLALRNNRTLLSIRYRREIQKFSLEVSEDRYRPQASIGTSVRHEKGSDAPRSDRGSLHRADRSDPHRGRAESEVVPAADGGGRPARGPGRSASRSRFSRVSGRESISRRYAARA